MTRFKTDGTEIVNGMDRRRGPLDGDAPGGAIDEREPRGGWISDDTMLVLLNGSYEDVYLELPQAGGDGVDGNC
jgi:hypothetical protein